ncbi:unnamed protein product, partial [marine sediment metagenome]
RWVPREFSSLGAASNVPGKTLPSGFASALKKVRKVLAQIGLETERVQTFFPSTTNEDLAGELDKFAEQIGGLYLASAIMQEVKS